MSEYDIFTPGKPHDANNENNRFSKTCNKNPEKAAIDFQDALLDEGSNDLSSNARCELAIYVALLPGANIELCQKVACTHGFFATEFCKHIPEANIAICQKYACKIPRRAVEFAKNISEANICYCQKHACRSAVEAYSFSYIPEADIEHCYNNSDGWEDGVREFILNEL